MIPHTESELETATPRIRDRLLTTFHLSIVLGGFLLFFAAYLFGVLFNALYLLLLVLVLGMGFSRAFGACWGSLELRFIRMPFAPAYRKYLLQGLNQWIFLILAVVALRLAPVPVQFEPKVYQGIQLLIVGAAGVLMLLGLVPHKRVRLSINSFFAVGWIFLGVQLFPIFLPSSNDDAVVLAPPFEGEFYIVNGGQSTLINNHYRLSNQRYALDIITTKNGRDVGGDETQLESYPVFGTLVVAPADGEVVKVVNDRADVRIGETDLNQIAGNQVVLDIGQGRFLLMAHLKKGSIRVSPGDRVTQGQALAECGNSGNTSRPHLHLQVQSRADFHASDLRTFPILFRDVTRIRAGQPMHLKEADVRRNDIVFITEAAKEE